MLYSAESHSKGTSHTKMISSTTTTATITTRTTTTTTSAFSYNTYDRWTQIDI